MFVKNPSLVLLVEDSPDDVDFARRALATSGIAHRLVVAEEGEEALRLLAEDDGQAAGSGPPRPALILLDLNIPGIPGRELLRRLKGDPRTSTIPVVVLSTSRHAIDVEGCYRDRANAYHAKSDDFARYQATLRQIVEYWLSAVEPTPVGNEALGEPCASADARA